MVPRVFEIAHKQAPSILAVVLQSTTDILKWN